MTTVYKTVDGEFFYSEAEANKHEAWLATQRHDRVKNNLDRYLSNKSRLKSGILKRDLKKLAGAWERWLKVAPKTPYKTNATTKDFTKIQEALIDLEEASLKYSMDLKKLAKAKEMIPRLVAAKKLGKNPEAYYSEDLLVIPTGVTG